MNVTIKIGSIQIIFNPSNVGEQSSGVTMAGPFGSVEEMLAAVFGAKTEEGSVETTGQTQDTAPAADPIDETGNTQADLDAGQETAANTVVDPAIAEQDAEVAQETPAPAITVAAVLSFLTASEKYNLRTEKSLFKHFGGESKELVALLETLANTDGFIATKKRRKDRAVLVYATDAGKSYLALFASAVAPSAETQAEAPAAEVATEAKPELTTANLHAFLSSSDKYSKRSTAAIAKHFGIEDGGDELAVLLGQAQGENAITSKWSRRKQTYLHAAVSSWSAPSPVEAVAADADGEEPVGYTAPELNVTNLRTFLNSDARFAKRTKRSIQKHFGIATDDHTANTALVALLTKAKEEGDISTTSRASDRTTLYAAA